MKEQLSEPVLTTAVSCVPTDHSTVEHQHTKAQGVVEGNDTTQVPMVELRKILESKP